MAAPYILARTMREAHLFAREGLGLGQGYYRIVNSPGTVKSVRSTDLYLVPGWEDRFDRFAMKGAIRWTRMNVIDVAAQAQEPEPVVEDEPDTVTPEAVPDNLEPAGEQLVLTPDEFDRVTAELEKPAEPVEALLEPLKEVARKALMDFAKSELVGSDNGDTMISEGGPVAPEPETEKPKKRRRSRCKDCDQLHFKGDPCPDEE